MNRNMDIFAVASNLIEKIDLRNKKIRLIGIKSSNLVRWEVEQLSLFELSSHNLDQIVDELKTRFPEVKIIPARLLKSDNIK
ncbi:hypothetical protein [Thermosyntropha lipolytica]|uniref:DinB/UmuC family translesion DNA polymerase n=1 Tax=Thermosyntropha lipolytica TaxID=54294 RepID=UPI003BFA7351